MSFLKNQWEARGLTEDLQAKVRVGVRLSSLRILEGDTGESVMGTAQVTESRCIILLMPVGWRCPWRAR